MNASSALTSVEGVFHAQRQASRQQVDVPLAVRLDRLARLAALIEQHGPALAQAVQADFGVRAPQLTEVAEFTVVRAALGQLRRKLRQWMKPQRVATPLYLMPGRGEVHRQPLGVVGIIGPWNYPLQLTLGPLAAALAAGNRVMIKPSELTPHTSAALAQCLHAVFAPDEVYVVQGGVEVAQTFAALPFDHLFFTGSTAVGRLVAQAAARNLTPTTLELGGKSPCVLDTSARLASAAASIAHGKLLNAGQTCIAPDYVFLPEGMEDHFTEAYRAAVATLFPTLEGNHDYAAILTEAHAQRQQRLLAEAQAGGARVVDVGPPASQVSASGSSLSGRQVRPVLVFDAPADSRLMQEEIFGPALPVLRYRQLDEVVAWINARPRPLALYWFGDDAARQHALLSRTVSGGVTVNDTLMHIAHDNLPFGGVGDSGWGSYHGEAGFLRFTHQKSVFIQSRWAQSGLFHPPYGQRLDRLLALLKHVL